MNQSQVEAMLRNSFDSVSTIKEHVVRCERRFHGRPVAYYYFDYKDKIEEAAENLTAYQDALLAEHYYTHPGDTRWNYYLVFLLSDENYQRIRKSKLADTIEKDKIYTRKYVVPEQQLEQFLSKPPKAVESQPAPSLDISARWVDRLNAAGLAGVYGRAFRTEVVRRCIDGNPIPPLGIDDGVEDPHPSATGAAQIEEIHLKAYRPYPMKKDFVFGSMNLLVGPNGTGKTSLLEAIELSLCGATYRSGGESENDAIINIRFKGSSSFEPYEPKNPKKYQQRDLLWYGRSVSRGNDLHASFNRYNFYNADSAYRLSHETQAEDIDSAFSAIALGERANYIDRRLKEFEGDFEDKFKSLDQQLKNIEKEVFEQKERIESHAKIEGNSKSIFESFLRECESLCLVEALSSDPTKLKAEFDSNLFSLDASIKEVVQIGSWIRPISVSKIIAERKAITLVKGRLEDIRENLANLRKQDTEADGKRLALNSRHNLLKRAKVYFEFPRIGELSGVDDRVTKFRANRDRYFRAKDAVSKIDFEALEKLDQSSSLEELRQKAKTDEEEVRKEIARKEAEALSIEKTLSKTEAILTQLNSTAREYIDLCPDADKCPLCEADHQPEDFRKIVLEYKAPDASSLDLLELRSALIEDLGRLNEIGQIQLEILRATSLASILSDAGENKSPSLGDLIALAKDVPVLLEEWEGKLRELSQLQDQIKVAGVSESEFQQISAQLLFGFDGLVVSKANRERFDVVFKSTDDELEQLGEAESLRRSLVEKVIGEKDEAIATYLAGGDPVQKDVDVEIDRRAVVVDRLLEKVKFIRSLLLIPDDSGLEDFSLAVDSVVKALREYRRACETEARTDIEVRDAKRKVEDGESLAALIKPQHKRAKDAWDEIQWILKNDNKQSALSGFIEQNRAGIDSIFSKIHSPREFAGLVPGSTMLKKLGSTEAVPLSKVSTGQRAALALSLFFALNASLRKAPPVILIDDPVAHVDDLNTLSFLDYLRELVIGGERQIFFATASQKLGNLLEKKFQFLGEEQFKKYEFER